MDIQTIKSSLKMENLYFSKCYVERSPNIIDGDLKMSLSKSINKIAEHTYNVCLELSADKEDLHLVVVSNATFILESQNYENEKSLIEHNTVAIMFPFIRSQVTLMTSQPGMKPIIVPPINTSKI